VAPENENENDDLEARLNTPSNGTGISGIFAIEQAAPFGTIPIAQQLPLAHLAGRITFRRKRD
jgi:hypothetical protein